MPGVKEEIKSGRAARPDPSGTCRGALRSWTPGPTLSTEAGGTAWAWERGSGVPQGAAFPVPRAQPPACHPCRPWETRVPTLWAEVGTRGSYRGLSLGSREGRRGAEAPGAPPSLRGPSPQPVAHRRRRRRGPRGSVSLLARFRPRPRGRDGLGGRRVGLGSRRWRRSCGRAARSGRASGSRGEWSALWGWGPESTGAAVAGPRECGGGQTASDKALRGGAREGHARVGAREMTAARERGGLEREESVRDARGRREFPGPGRRDPLERRRRAPRSQFHTSSSTPCRGTFRGWGSGSLGAPLFVIPTHRLRTFSTL